jgi:thiamine-phosphate pyrophosphorylase
VSLLSNSNREPILCYVTDRRILSTVEPAGRLEVLLCKIGAAASAGVDWIQIREKDLFGRDSAWLTRQALKRAAESAVGGANPARILVNDRLDVALAERAGGVHLPEKGFAVPEAKRLANSRGQGKDFLVGVSCHGLEAARRAATEGADYIFFGPLFATPSKTAYGAPQGLERLAEVCRMVSVPVLAIGGITRENVAPCLSAGASGVAAIRLFQDTEDLASLVQAMRKPVPYNN